MTEQQCILSGEMFEVSDFEMKLRKKFGFLDPPKISPKMRFRHLGAFWQHWNLHKRKCDKTGKDIISVFSEDCPYPVWHKNEWIKNTDPPGEDFNEHEDVFPQMWNVFQNSPIPHNVGTNNENCEFTDDWWYSKNCYLCHSGIYSEDVKYSYRLVRLKDCQFCVYSFDSELCTDLVNSSNCFNSLYLLHSKHCSDSAFLYDCRNCQNCLFSFNLRNKKYCIGNQQFTKEKYMEIKKQWDFSSRKTYDSAKEKFVYMMKTLAWHNALQVEKSENSTGNFLENAKNCENCYFASDLEDSANTCRIGVSPCRNILDSVSGATDIELVYSSVTFLECHEIKCCYNVANSNFCEYSAFLENCEHCFGCCGLVGKKYHIFNKVYSKDEYENLKEKIIQKMKETGEYGWFFPGYFAANAYEESWSSFYFPLSQQEQEQYEFRQKNETPHEKVTESSFLSEIPDSSRDADNSLSQKLFWDEDSQRHLQILKGDTEFAKKISSPLPHCFYVKRIQENFKWMFFTGSLRKTRCAKSGKEIETNYPKEFDERILCGEEYLKILE